MQCVVIWKIDTERYWNIGRVIDRRVLSIAQILCSIIVGGICVYTMTERVCSPWHTGVPICSIVMRVPDSRQQSADNKNWG